MRNLIAPGLLLLLVTAVPVSGQAFSEIFYDSIAEARNPVALAASRDAALKDATSTTTILRGAFAALRLWQLSAERANLETASRLFELAVDKEPLSAWAHLGLGQALIELSRSDPQSRAHRAIRAALELDPTLVHAALEGARQALLKREEERLHESRNALVTITRQTFDRRLWLSLADVENALGLTAAAQNAAENILRADSADPLGRLALARALFPQKGKAATAGESYFAGLTDADSIASERYFDDLVYILRPDERVEWQALQTSARAAWIRRFWEMRAARSGVTVHERIAEHYSRLTDAWARYRRQTERGAPPIGSLIMEQFGDLPFDDRGHLLVRHGRPMDVISTITNGFPANETWVYRQHDTGGFRLINFMKYEGSADYRLMAQLPLCDTSRHSDSDPAVRQGILTPYDARWVEGVIQYYEDRGKYEQGFHQLAARCHAATLGRRIGSAMIDTAAVHRDAAQLGMQLQREVLRALDTDSDEPDFDVPITFIHRLYAFRGGAATADLTASLLVPGDRILPVRTSAGNTVYPVGVSLILVDSLARQITRLDSVLHFESTRALARDDFLRLHVTVNAPLSSATEYRLVLRDAIHPDRGGVVSGKVPARLLASRGLELSDIVIAESDSGRWLRGRVELALMPPHEIDADQPFVLFYEVYNIPAARAYTAEVSIAQRKTGTLAAVRGLLGGRPGNIRFTYAGESTDAEVNQVSHRIGGDLEPGAYRLRVTVTDQLTQERASRETELIILPRSGQRVRTGAPRK